MRLYFVRHGESTANCLHEFSNSGNKHSLTEKGIAQAQALARGLRGIGFSRIYTSPISRAVQTARILAEHFDAPVVQTEALREWSVGIYEGTSDPTGWDAHRRVQQDWFVHQRLESKMPGGENFLEIQARFVPFIESLVLEFGATDQNLICVSHGGLYLAMLPVILQNVDHAFVVKQGFPYTGCVVAEQQEAGLRGLSWCGQFL